MRIQHNIVAMFNNRQAGIIGGEMKQSISKLSSGYRINKAADDAAGLSISEKMRKQVRGLTQASENAEDGISCVQTADGALTEVTEMLQRMNELCVQAANGTNSEMDRRCIQDEVDQLKTEIDRVAESTKFNEIYLLNGSIGKKTVATVTSNNYMTMQDAMALDGLKLIYTEVKHDVVTTQTGTGATGLSGTAYDGLVTQLKEAIVPQAITALLSTFPQTFNYLSGSSIGIGLELYEDNSSTLASVTIGASAQSNGTSFTANYLAYKLSVNVRTLKDAQGNIDLTANRDDLEVTIIHEMMHAMMDEVLTNGMIGYGGGTSFDTSVQFPSWFKEGMAQAAAGGCYNGNDWVNGSLGINAATSEADISTILQSAANNLNSRSTSSEYGTGYLACMYLGYLANGGGTVSASGIQAGLDKILSDLKGDSTTPAKSLNEVIAAYTSYANASAFQSGFGDSASSHFVSELVKLVGTNGTGGLAADFSNQSGILSDSAVVPAIQLFELDPNNGFVQNVYPAGYPVFSGGTLSTSGTSGPNSSAGNNGITGGTVVKRTVAAAGFMRLQIGADAENGMFLQIDAMNTDAIGIRDVDVTTEKSATQSIDRVSVAIAIVSEQRSRLGAYQNRLEHTIKNLDNIVENTQAAESQIRDTDMEKEIVYFSNRQLLQQAAQAMLTQANQMNQGVLSLVS